MSAGREVSRAPCQLTSPWDSRRATGRLCGSIASGRGSRGVLERDVRRVVAIGGARAFLLLPGSSSRPRRQEHPRRQRNIYEAPTSTLRQVGNLGIPPSRATHKHSRHRAARATRRPSRQSPTPRSLSSRDSVSKLRSSSTLLRRLDQRVRGYDGGVYSRNTALCPSRERYSCQPVHPSRGRFVNFFRIATGAGYVTAVRDVATIFGFKHRSPKLAPLGLPAGRIFSFSSDNLACLSV